MKDDTQESEKPSPKTPPKKGKQAWTPDEDEALMLAVIADRQRREDNDEEEEEEDWDEIAKAVPGKTPVNCLRRYMGQLNKKEEKAEGASLPASAKRGTPDEEDEESFSSHLSKKTKLAAGEEDGDWTQEEVDLLKKLVEQYQGGEYMLYPGEPILAASLTICCCYCAFYK